MAAARLRKTFRYPEDSDDDEHEREELDEEGPFVNHRNLKSIWSFTDNPAEQESVIERLRVQNDKRNAEYSITFAAIPLLSAAVFIPSMFSGSLYPQGRFFTFISVLSLVATAYTMKYIPLRRPDPKGKRPMRNPDFQARLQKLLLPMNIAVCSLLLVVFLSSSRMESVHNKQSIAYIVPGAMLAIIMLARQVMVSVDLKHLEDLQYEYKGV
ncbi:hypothetical protein BDV29DRAFT_89992 [Aspergillus leporis]|uniref:Transmembrane protein n=1 Tax=Aspergillus leporis TaxID=41062 RepID=A0A5N5X8D1_9EURO|nr:hypothetical protein BDV29DRAFT_89992 [Aspergillus leporis]